MTWKLSVDRQSIGFSRRALAAVQTATLVGTLTVPVLPSLTGLATAGGVAVAALTASSWTVSAEAQISGSVMAASHLSAEDKQEVDAFISAQIDQLVSGDPKAVSSARLSILDVYSRWSSGSGSKAFADYFNPKLAKQLQAAMAGAPLLTKVNAALIAGRIVDPQVVPLAQTLLADANGGVRFRAAASVGELADRDVRLNPADRLDEQVWQTLLTACVDQLKIEAEPIVFERLLVAMGKLPLQQATEQVLVVLDGRVGFQSQNAGAPIGAELEALKQVVLYINSRPVEARQQLTRQIMAVSMKLAKIALRDLNAGGLSDTQIEERAALLRYIEAYVLRDASLNTFNASATRLPGDEGDLDALIRAANWRQATELFDQWQTFLLGSPIELEANQLRVPN